MKWNGHRSDLPRTTNTAPTLWKVDLLGCDCRQRGLSPSDGNARVEPLRCTSNCLQVPSTWVGKKCNWSNHLQDCLTQFHGNLLGTSLEAYGTTKLIQNDKGHKLITGTMALITSMACKAGWWVQCWSYILNSELMWPPVKRGQYSKWMMPRCLFMTFNMICFWNG